MPAQQASELDQAAARGVMPEKPIVTSATNQHYQKRFDRLAELAAVGDWTAIAAYEVKGNNTYAKEVARYRDRLLAAHSAQEASAQLCGVLRTSLDRLLLDFPPDTAWASGASDQRIFILRRHRLTLRAATRRTIRWICPR